MKEIYVAIHPAPPLFFGMALEIPEAAKIHQAQEQWTAEWHSAPPAPPSAGLIGLVQANHWFNFSLWHEEDQARRDDQGHEHVYKAKRAIDRYNQQRNDAMERIDQFLIDALQPSPQAPQNSETPGMMIDRLSIMALKAFHMQEEVDRPDASEEHRQKCQSKLTVLHTQRSDLVCILGRFLNEVSAGERSFKVYFQFKMYNDPSLNPQLYRQANKG